MGQWPQICESSAPSLPQSSPHAARRAFARCIASPQSVAGTALFAAQHGATQKAAPSSRQQYVVHASISRPTHSTLPPARRTGDPGRWLAEWAKLAKWPKARLGRLCSAQGKLSSESPGITGASSLNVAAPSFIDRTFFSRRAPPTRSALPLHALARALGDHGVAGLPGQGSSRGPAGVQASSPHLAICSRSARPGAHIAWLIASQSNRNRRNRRVSAQSAPARD